MKVVNFGDPYTEKISIRLSKRQASFVSQFSHSLSWSPSQFFRSLLDSFIFSSDQELYENTDACVDNQLQHPGVSDSDIK